jgi:hypothetical protein
MMTVIDRARQIVVDKSDFHEVVGAVAVDLDAGVVEVAARTATGEVHSSRYYPGGLRVIQRYPR